MPNKIYQIKITIRGINPPIWRRLLVPEDITFNKLHKIIQAAFGWQDYHLYNFDFGDTVVCIPDPDYGPEELYGPGVMELNAKKIKTGQFFTEHRKFTYTYDFGDNWIHDVEVEKALEAEKGKRYPICTGGERHRPPEDVGGIPGYENFLAVISDSDDPEYEDMLLWAEKDTGGRKFDPDYFYINETNRLLGKIK